MLNDPQGSNNSSPFYAEEPVVMTTETEQQVVRHGGLLFGMTAIQRFIVMLLIFFLTCILGSLCLLLSGKVVLF